MFDPIIIFYLIILLFSVIIHELSHGYIANSLGDPTAKYAGRLTLNPLPHLDLFGSIMLPALLFISTGGAFVFGWAKPVPINPYNLKDQKWGSLKVAIAGPISNIALAVFFGLLIRFIPQEFFLTSYGFGLKEVFFLVVRVNIMLAVFNLIPIPPLDGSWILFKFFPQNFEKARLFLSQYGIIILLLFLFSGLLDQLNYVAIYIVRLITGI
ncbi:MAG: hypothetical protein A3C58_02980 [Candidatus Staskawiczbacteria bacterium RIFCSPHIGHO2_02_FULL_34_10]|uniref:Peptidase M50 domain-containing protein n=2 Tax=Candidatus Staskawicziibacteriota TaxID=1817916 RepID=A0A1G2HIR6_9BACT|nr:MAG: hypothetical protein A2639_00860 [Candidatus Staskawiczbacteria bacterium RIFCSPHIGHO2_01_FULL_34_27]OGZ67760.1 MAG: hypothetical protein A3C58_02980 [Candidatus Staskawiczbacteria bacterium RIFCSPHIGHO2_02_FULL_34_10]